MRLAGEKGILGRLWGDTGAALGLRIKGKGILGTTKATPYTSLALVGGAPWEVLVRKNSIQEVKELLKLQTKRGGPPIT